MYVAGCFEEFSSRLRKNKERSDYIFAALRPRAQDLRDAAKTNFYIFTMVQKIYFTPTFELNEKIHQ